MWHERISPHDDLPQRQGDSSPSTHRQRDTHQRVRMEREQPKRDALFAELDKINKDIEHNIKSMQDKLHQFILISEDIIQNKDKYATSIKKVGDVLRGNSRPIPGTSEDDWATVRECIANTESYGSLKNEIRTIRDETSRLNKSFRHKAISANKDFLLIDDLKTQFTLKENASSDLLDSSRKLNDHFKLFLEFSEERLGKRLEQLVHDLDSSISMNREENQRIINDLKDARIQDWD